MLKMYGFLKKEGSGPVSQLKGSEGNPWEKLVDILNCIVHRTIYGVLCCRLLMRIY